MQMLHTMMRQRWDCNLCVDASYWQSKRAWWWIIKSIWRHFNQCWCALLLENINYAFTSNYESMFNVQFDRKFSIFLCLANRIRRVFFLFSLLDFWIKRTRNKTFFSHRIRIELVRWVFIWILHWVKCVFIWMVNGQWLFGNW